MGDSYVTSTAMMTCTFGMAPSSLVVNPARTVFLCGRQKANIMDYVPMTNIMPFGMCTTPSNPTVAAATSAAMGVLTPMPCIPNITAPWMPGNPKVLVQGQPALMRSCRCMCMWGGVIQFTNDGQLPMPPEVVIPPVMASVPQPDSLSQEQQDAMSDEQRQQYNTEFEQASHSGDSDAFLSATFDQVAKDYEKQGQPQKAAEARAASEKYAQRGAQRNAQAMEEVNERYQAPATQAPAPAKQAPAPAKQASTPAKQAPAPAKQTATKATKAKSTATKAATKAKDSKPSIYFDENGLAIIEVPETAPKKDIKLELL